MMFFYPLGMIFFILFAIFAVGFWIAMLIDCLKRKNFDDKLVWVIVLCLLGLVGAVIYYFLVKAKKTKR